MGYRIAIDTGGTFTDLVLADEQGNMYLGKAPTTFERIFGGIEGALGMVAEQLEMKVAAVLGHTDLLIYGTTHATNARLLRARPPKLRCWLPRGFPTYWCSARAARPIPTTFRRPIHSLIFHADGPLRFASGPTRRATSCCRSITARRAGRWKLCASAGSRQSRCASYGRQSTRRMN